MIQYTILPEPAEEDGYVVHVPALTGCHTQGDSLEEALAMAQNAILLYLEDLSGNGQSAFI